MLDALLVTVTVVSLLLAGTLAIISWRVLQLDRRRSDLRVASLQEAARQITERNSGVAGVPAWTGLGTGLGADLGSVPASPGAATSDTPGDLFATQESSGRTSRLFMAAAVSTAFVALVATGAMLSGRGTRAESGAAPAPAAVPLELLALDHVREGARLAIRGIIKNPARASVRKDVVAVAYLFDRSGGYLGSFRAQLAGSALAPGTESRFEIPVPDARTVGRYRVTFQADLSLVPHVDCRPAPDAGAVPASRVALAQPGRDGAAPAPAGR